VLAALLLELDRVLACCLSVACCLCVSAVASHTASLPIMCACAARCFPGSHVAELLFVVRVLLLWLCTVGWCRSCVSLQCMCLATLLICQLRASAVASHTIPSLCLSCTQLNCWLTLMFVCQNATVLAGFWGLL
jgi:hypothetical protein